MATPDPSMSDLQAHDHPMEEETGHRDTISEGFSIEAPVANVDSGIPDNKPELPADKTRLYGHIPEAVPSDADQDSSAKSSLPASYCSPDLTGHGESSSPCSKHPTQEDERPPQASTSLTFPRLDRGDFGFGHTRSDAYRTTTRGGIPRPTQSSIIQVDDTHNIEDTTESTVHLTEDSHSGHDHNYPSTRATLDGSDTSIEGCAQPAEWQSNESVSRQVNEQIHREASMSDDIEHVSSPTTQSEDVIYMGANPSQHSQAALDSFTTSKRNIETLQRSSHISNAAGTQSVRGSLSNAGDDFQSPGRKITQSPFPRKPTPGSRILSRERASRPEPTAGGVKELLEVVEYKFKQNEQRLRQAFSTDNDRTQTELQQACEENEELRSQLAALDERCNRSEAAIIKYRSQIRKAKSLQKFLDGLGVDLQSLKRSHDLEKDNFARRIEASDTEIQRLESTLAGKDRFESMLSHSKTSLEKLLEARGYEIQSLVQHRDLLRNQLDERIGQLVEERDNRMRLEQLVVELRSRESLSLTKSIEQCVESLAPKLGDLGRQDDQLLLSIAGIQTAVNNLTQRPITNPDDFDTIKAAVHDLGLQTAQMLSTDSNSHSIVAEVCSSVEGIIQNYVGVVRRELDRLESSSKQTVGEASTKATSEAELQHVSSILERTESQLEMARQREKTLSDALAQAEGRISALEAASTSTTTLDTSQTSSHEVEKKISEAVATTRKELSDNARTFIAQEKAKYTNELKKATNDHRKAAEKARTYEEKTIKLQGELDEMQSLHAARDDRRSSLQKREVDPDLDVKLAEGEAAKARIPAYDNKIAELTQGIEQRNVDLLHARSMREQAQAKAEEERRQKQSDIDDLCQKISQVEEEAKAVEARITQTKIDAERTISTEQEKHRKEQEMLQHRLDQAQSELQMRSEEADDARAFMERNVAQQQELWHTSNAELEAKASRYRIMLEEERQGLQRVRNSQDDLRAAVSKLEAEIKKHRQQEIDYNVREDANQVIIADLRAQVDASKSKIAELQAVQQRYLREKDERLSREAKTESTLDDLRKELAAVKVEKGHPRVSQEQNQNGQAHVRHSGSGLTQDKRNERGAAQSVPDGLQAIHTESSQLHTEGLQDGRELSKQQRRLTVAVPRMESQLSEVPKQRKKADRNTNTIVTSGVRTVHVPALATHALDHQHVAQDADFRIYEDPHDSPNHGLGQDSTVNANQRLFRKPVPLPNSGSKRLTRTTSDKSMEGRSIASRGSRRTPENSFGQFSSQIYKTPEASKYPFGSSPEFMNPNTKTKRRYSGNSNGTPRDVKSPAIYHPETSLPDPRIVARPIVGSRVPEKRGRQDDMLEPPTKKKSAISATQSTSDRTNDDTFLGRSSQSVSSLPRMSDLNVGRISQLSSSNMRSSAEPRRITRSQKSTRGDAFQARFSQELRRRS